MNSEFCCRSLQLLMENAECPLRYVPYHREYVMTVPKHYLKKNEVSMCYTMKYCPCCGTQFPQSLSDAWWDIMEEQFGITEMFDPKIKKLPTEFKADQWWKDRGL